MRSILSAFCLALVIFCGATTHAQEQQPTDTVTHSVDAQPDVLQEWTSDWDPRRHRRMAALGMMAGAAFTVGGIYTLHWGLTRKHCGDRYPESCEFVPEIGTLTSLFTVTSPSAALAVYGAGRLSGGLGRYDMTLLGAAAGHTVGLGLFGLTAWALQSHTSDETRNHIFRLAPLLTQALGAYAAYMLSHRVASRRGTTRYRRQQRAFTPTLSPTRNGGALGVAGIF